MGITSALAPRRHCPGDTPYSSSKSSLEAADAHLAIVPLTMRPTLIFQDRTVSPDQFEMNWRRSAAALQAVGVREGDVVALMMRNSPQAIELMVATRHLARSGAR